MMDPILHEGQGMGSVAPLAADQERKDVPQVAGSGEGEKALVPAPAALGPSGPVMLSPLLARISVELDVAVPIRGFRLRDLVGLDRGQVIETRWDHGEDLPLSVGVVQLAWTEFEVIDTRLAVRITRLA